MKPDHIIIREINPEELFQAVRQIVREEIANATPDPQPETPHQQEEKKVFNSEEASQYLRIARRTLYQKVKENKIKHSKDGILLFTKEQLDEYLKNHKQDGN